MITSRNAGIKDQGMSLRYGAGGYEINHGTGLAGETLCTDSVAQLFAPSSCSKIKSSIVLCSSSPAASMMDRILANDDQVSPSM
jgi:hypothetical protein